MATKKKTKAVPKPAVRAVDPELLRPVAQGAQLLDLSIQSLQADCHVPAYAVEGELGQSVRIWASPQGPEDPNHLAVAVTVRQEVSQGDELVLDIRASYALIYRFDEGLEAFSSEQLDLFAEVNAVFNVWPYLREVLDTTATRFGFAMTPMPTWKAPATLPPKGQPIELRRGPRHDPT